MNSRRKGKTGELEAAHYLSALFKLPVRRGQQFRGGPDSPDVVGLDGLHIEVKRTERLNLDTALEQAARDAGETEVPVVLHRGNRRRWKLTINADDLLPFLDAAGSLIDEGHRAAVAAEQISPGRAAGETSGPPDGGMPGQERQEATTKRRMP